MKALNERLKEAVCMPMINGNEDKRCCERIDRICEEFVREQKVAEVQGNLVKWVVDVDRIFKKEVRE